MQTGRQTIDMAELCPMQTDMQVNRQTIDMAVTSYADRQTDMQVERQTDHRYGRGMSNADRQTDHR